MGDYAEKLNTSLVSCYDKVARLEELMVNTLSNMNLSIRELHMLEFISEEEGGQTISDIAMKAGITPPSVTTAVKKLEKRGYVEKKRSVFDGRIVYVRLTKAGRKINSAHKYYHLSMMRKVAESLTTDEENALLSAIDKLSSIITKSIEKYEKRTSLK